MPLPPTSPVGSASSRCGSGWKITWRRSTNCRRICGLRIWDRTMKPHVETALNRASAGDTPQAGTGFDVRRGRRDFPILAPNMRGRPPVSLDSAATTQKPQVVIDALKRYYESQNANIHRGVYTLSQVATDLYEAARHKAQRFLNAAEPQEIIFTRGTTEGINLVAASYGRAFLGEGDEVVISAMEHHSNIVPWQMICQQT